MRKSGIFVAFFLVMGLFLPLTSPSSAWEVVYGVQRDKTMFDSVYNPVAFVPGNAGDYYLLGSHGAGLAVLIHLSPMGEVLWVKNLSLSQELPLNLPYGQYQVVSDIAVGNDGIYVVLRTNGVLNVSAPDDWIKGDPLFTLVKFDFSGNPVWVRAFKNSKGGYSGIRVQPTGDGAIVVAPVYAHMHHKNPDDPYDWEGIASALDIGAIKFDSSGNLEWIHIYGRESIHEYVNAVGFDGSEVAIAFSSSLGGPDLGFLAIDPETGKPEWVREYKQAVDGGELWKMGRFNTLSGGRPMLYSVPDGWLYTNGLPGKYDGGASIWVKLDRKGNILWSGFWNTTLYNGESPAGFALADDGNYVFFDPLVKMSPSGDVLRVYYDVQPHSWYIARAGNGFAIFLLPDRLLKLDSNMSFAGCDVHHVEKGGELTAWVPNFVDLGKDDVKFVKVPLYSEASFEGTFEFDDLPTWEWYRVAPVDVWVHDHPSEYFHVEEACNQTGSSEGGTEDSAGPATSVHSPATTSEGSGFTSPSPSSGSSSEGTGTDGGVSVDVTCGPGIMALLALLVIAITRRR
ncbi:CGP-CTERM sorting domain-containing protein [Thermococcus sp. GR7]|uniref:CGP-CTERM sorting domain-containing protein n=1 Tax=unclassified Thermococcus TaxID=2627626 RepID=UPI00142F944D|nr:MULTISPECIES: CGP-CTERM sorting domain-containing protein [unclassified Thermococcus]NJE46727.1 CGP-CTERM sorting domain-containing protein [Thermococcus sp. GR7]NJE77845.1 CGP-CTERM sorting domain-containing protein [Thermococcus sp. GR4]NJF22973.1 CGP-CTERM sorting domain-containing protein [Thermococcus sp. GR5]